MTSRFAITGRTAALTVLGTCACLACAPTVTETPRDAHQWVRAFCSVRFSSPHEITLIIRRFDADSERSRLTSIVEIGGRVVAYQGDTLVIEPFYLTISESGARRITSYRSGQPRFPDLALVVIEKGVAIGDFHTPRLPRSPEQTIAIVLGAGFMLLLFYTDIVVLLSL